MIKLTENFELRKSGQYFALVEITEGKDKDGNPKPIENKREFGTVYQALQAFLDVNFDLEQPLIDNIKKSLEAIQVNKDLIKKHFRLEVKSCKPKGDK